MQPHKVKDQEVEGGSQNQVQLTSDSLALFEVRTADTTPTPCFTLLWLLERIAN